MEMERFGFVGFEGGKFESDGKVLDLFIFLLD
jgi:hypothetical protein